ncbi:putative PAF acetylhydrolase family protein [Rosellinia necatrix]|uniref:1-alkyl-2-acetylglycerophosphocholine esterase n=1 Tax=Rosellinia necatrix TaxID=77044 RepID=A0A1W2TJ23_ROSNE|nr:putative PAF acetylhydrolase family protein [Rosellinia necatrix]
MALTVLFATLAATAALAQVFPCPGGPYKVRWENKELVDAGRADPFNASHLRRVLVSHFTPVAGAHCARACRLPYMPPRVAAIEDDILTSAFQDLGWPAGLLAGLEVDVCCETSGHAEAAAAEFPVVLFGTGLNTTRLWYTDFAMEIASLGYQVIVMDHPYETDVVLFPDGEIVFGGAISNDPNNLTALEFGLDVRTADVSFILDTFGLDKTVYFGHSFGGASAAAATMVEPRISGGLNLDGELWGPVVNAGVPRKFINFSGSLNSTIDESWKNFTKAHDEKHPDVWIRELHLEKSSHGSFWDLSIIADFTGLRENKDLVEYVLGELTGKRAVEVLRPYLDDYFKFALLDGPEGLLAGESEEFPDVKFIR